MKQDYFEERLKGILEEGEEHPFDQDQWRRLDRRLSGADQPATPFWLRWLPVAFLLLLGLSAWQHFTLSRQIDDLEASLRTDKQPDETTRVRTTIIYDTIYRRTTVEEKVSTLTPSGQTPTSAKNDVSQLGGVTLYPTAAPYAFSFAGSLTDSDQPADERSYPTPGPPVSSLTHSGLLEREFREYRQRLLFTGTEDAPAKEIFYDQLVGVRGLPREPLAMLEVNGPAFPTFSAPAPPPYSPPKPSLWRRLQPKSYTLDVGGGGLLENAFPEGDAGLQAGIGLNLGFGKRIGLRVGADYVSRAFFLGEDDIDRFDLPTAEPREDEDELESISGKPNLLQLPLGVRLELLRAGNFSAFAGAGVVATMALPSDLRYTFEEDGEEDYYDVLVEDGRNRALRAGAWYGDLGLRYDWRKRWGVQLTATRQQGFGDLAYPYEAVDFLYYRLSGVWRLAAKR